MNKIRETTCNKATNSTAEFMEILLQAGEYILQKYNF